MVRQQELDMEDDRFGGAYFQGGDKVRQNDRRRDFRAKRQQAECGTGRDNAEQLEEYSRRLINEGFQNSVIRFVQARVRDAHRIKMGRPREKSQ